MNGLEIGYTAILGPVSITSRFRAFGTSNLASQGVDVFVRQEVVIIAVFKVVFFEVVLQKVLFFRQNFILQNIVFSRGHGLHDFRVCILLGNDGKLQGDAGGVEEADGRRALGFLEASSSQLSMDQYGLRSCFGSSRGR